MTNTEPDRCSWSDLPVDQCAHCKGLPDMEPIGLADLTNRSVGDWQPAENVIHIAQLEQLAGRRLPEYRWTKRSPEWKVAKPEPVTCDHREDDLCGDCSSLLDDILEDLPHIIEELTTTLTKGSRFAPRGWAKGDEERPDEAPIPWSVAASSVLGEAAAYQASSEDLSRHEQLAKLSSIATRAHHIIERPKDRHITQCPHCQQVLWLEAKTGFECPTEGCGYACDTWSTHLNDLINTRPDVMLTMDELVLVFGGNPETVRKRIQRAVTNQGLPREHRKVWRDGAIVEGPWVYRLSDVRHYTHQETA